MSKKFSGHLRQPLAPPTLHTDGTGSIHARSQPGKEWRYTTEPVSGPLKLFVVQSESVSLRNEQFELNFEYRDIGENHMLNFQLVQILVRS